MKSDFEFLKKALDLAKKGRGYCSPNPAVGSLIVKNNLIISEGYHQGVGCAHAEVDALSKVSAAQALGATLFVTLEPCNHTGRTPPCVAAIQKAGISEVVYAYRDPNPQVHGFGHLALEAANIKVRHLPQAEIDEFYRPYHYWLTTQQPLVTLKIAMSLDGKIAGPQKSRIAISGEQANAFTHDSRKMTDAILTTEKTLYFDDPQLTARSTDQIERKKIYVIDRELKCDFGKAIWKSAKELIFCHSEGVSKKRCEEILAVGARLIALPEKENKLDLKALFSAIGREGIHELWVEVGQAMLNALLTEQLLNRLIIFIAPYFVGAEGLPAFTLNLLNGNDQIDLKEKLVYKNFHWEILGRDAKLTIDF